MVGPHPAVAEVRSAVRAALTGRRGGALVLAACSGGADSLALAAALAFEAPRAGLRGGALVVDHGLQPGSAEHSRSVAGRLESLGLAPVRVLTVRVGTDGGPEAAARSARYAALDDAATELDAATVLLGHTLDDQAETVLLRLARGSGSRSLSGMAPLSGRYRRPLLAVARETTRAACTAQGLTPWDDPHNDEPRFARVRVRQQAMPALVAALGPGVREALARTAALCREDADALDEWAAAAAGAAAGQDGSLDVDVLAGLPAAVRGRVLRATAVAAGAPTGAVGQVHIEALDALVTRWHGQQAVALPGGVSGERACGRLLLHQAHELPPDPKE